MRFLPALAVPSLLFATVLTGCHVTSNKNGKNDNVDIGTPFGNMQVKTNDNVDAASVGITPYPGAQMIKKDNGKDDGAADVNMSFGSFHLGVKAASYSTPDGQDKVLAFYRKDLAKYGPVLLCEGKRAIGEPTRTPEGLTCDDSSKGRGFQFGKDDDDEHKMELRAGSKSKQHIVAIQKKDGATKVSLVALDLPTSFGVHTDKDGDKDSD